MNPFRRKRLIRVLPDDRFEILFPEPITAMLAEYGRQLGQILDDDDPGLRRLFPSAYPDDPDLDAAYTILARSELADARRAEIAVLNDTVDAESVSRDELLSWMRVTNDLRLVLGTRLDVSEDDLEDEEGSPAHEVYHVLGLVLDEIVAALSSGLD